MPRSNVIATVGSRDSCDDILERSGRFIRTVASGVLPSGVHAVATAGANTSCELSMVCTMKRRAEGMNRL